MNISDCKTKKVTHTTALLRAANTEREGLVGLGGNENSRTLSTYAGTIESDRAQHLCYF